MATPRVFCRLRLLINKNFLVVSKNNIVRNTVFLNKNFQVQVVGHFRTHVGTGIMLDKSKPEGEQQDSSSSSDSDSDDDDLERAQQNHNTYIPPNYEKGNTGKQTEFSRCCQLVYG